MEARDKAADRPSTPASVARSIRSAESALSRKSHESSGEQAADRPNTPPQDAAVERAQFPTESIETSNFDEPAKESDIMGATSFDSSGSATSVAESVARSIRSVKSALSRKSHKSSGEKTADRPSVEVETAVISIPDAVEARDEAASVPLGKK